jgi:hypothetical protein
MFTELMEKRINQANNSITENDYKISPESFDNYYNSQDKLNILKMWLSDECIDYKLFAIRHLNKLINELSSIDQEDAEMEEIFIILLAEFTSTTLEKARVRYIDIGCFSIYIVFSDLSK